MRRATWRTFLVPSNCYVSFVTAIKLISFSAKVVDSLELYAPVLKGLQEVHAYTCERLESLVFDQTMPYDHSEAAAFLYGKISSPVRSQLTDLAGQVMALSPHTSDAVALAVQNLWVVPNGRNSYRRVMAGTPQPSTLALCVLLGVERGNKPLFESNLPLLLQQIQVVAFSSEVGGSQRCYS